MPEFSTFDQRRYPTVPVREGYGAWQPAYDDAVQDIMDLGALEQITSVQWERLRAVADLGCGTGRTAAWLVSQGAMNIDGVDLTPEMLSKARERGLHRRLEQGDVRSTGLPTGAYDLAICSLVDEHLPDLVPLYKEARRITGSHGKFIVVGYHPFFIMGSGMPTHFDGPAGQVAIETFVHLPSEHVAAARSVGFGAAELIEVVIDDDWIQRKSKWERYRDWPISFAWVWSLLD